MIGKDDLVVAAAEVIEHTSLTGLTPPQLVAVEQIIAGVQGGLEDYLGRPVTIRQFTETAEIEDWDTGRLPLQQSPVRSIISRTPVDRPAINPGGVLALDSIFGMPTDILGLSGFYEVVYTAGIDGKNDESIRLKVMEVSARYIRTHHDDVLTGTPETASRPNPPSVQYWSPDELRQFDRKRRRTMV